jgi:hypothetical protein
MGSRKQQHQWHQRKLMSLKPGDKAYWISGNWGKPEVITITGECDEGDGYTAFSQRFADEYPPKDPEDVPGSIHTCNGFLAKTHKEARAESLRIAKELRTAYAEKQAEASQVIRYLDWVIARKGKH